MTSGDMGVARQGVQNENGVAPALVQTAVGLIGQRDWAELRAALQRQLAVERDMVCFDNHGR